MKSAGVMAPRVGWSQRTSASRPETSPDASLTSVERRRSVPLAQLPHAIRRRVPAVWLHEQLFDAACVNRRSEPIDDGEALANVAAEILYGALNLCELPGIARTITCAGDSDC
jgi:hypothetical protein